MFKNMPTAALIVPQPFRLYYKKINHSLQRVKSLQSSYLDMHVKCTLYNFCIERGWRCPIFSPVVTWGGGGGCLARTWLKKAVLQHAVFAVGVDLMTRHLENETKSPPLCLKR